MLLAVRLPELAVRGKTHGVPSLHVSSVGDYIREQREHAQVSLRQLAKSAGVSNPYLSQIERGLKKPSAEILQQIAKGLRISAETLYVQAGILEDRGATSDVVGVILADPAIDDRHKRVLIDIYESFRSEHAATKGTPPRKAAKKVAKPAKKPATNKRGPQKRATTKTTTTKTTTTKTAKTPTTRRNNA
jgi:transcriptional regulator with XRE-family HTH domain